jgi:signal transduction histidine kinase/HAMP domain-containing protein
MKSLRRLTLAKKIAFLTTLGVLLGVGLFSFLGMRAVDQATETMLQDRLTTARLMADYVDEALARALNELTSTARRVESNQAEGSFEAQISDLEATYLRLAFYTQGIYFVSETGQIIWSQPQGLATEELNILFYPTISQTVKSQEAGISGLVVAPVTRVPVILLTCPLKAGQHGEEGILVVAIDIARSSIGGFIQPIRLGQTGYVEIVDQNGIVVTRTEPGPELAPFEKSDHSGHFAALIAAGKPTRGLCHTCHEPVMKVEREDVLAFVPLSVARWGVVIRQSEEEALAPIRELRQNLLLAGIGLIVLTLLFVMVITENVVSRIRALTSASQKIAEGDLTSPVNPRGQDEVGVLAQTLDEMRAKLKLSRDELEYKTKELSSLLSVSEILTSLPDLSDLDNALGNALDKTLEITNRKVGSILLWDEDKQELYYSVQRGLSEQYVRGVRHRMGESIAGKVIQARKPILSEDASVDDRVTRSDPISIQGIHALASLPLLSKNKVLGVLNLASYKTHSFYSEELRLLEGIAGQIATAIDNAKLHREVQQKEQIRGELLGEIFSIQEEERKRIARELHDETSQVLASLNASLEAASSILPVNTEKSKDMLRKAQSLAVNILEEIHKLIYELRPSLLDDMGLVAAIGWLSDNHLVASGIKVNFGTSGRVKRLAPRLETALFRTVQEAVYNIARHANATNVSIDLQFKRKAIRIAIKDDGGGFDVGAAISSKNRPRGLGLVGMKERIELLNGVMEIKSHTGRGTEIDIEIPLKPEVDS